MLPRRDFLGRCIGAVGAVAATVVSTRPLGASARPRFATAPRQTHPEPRKGITGDKVLTKEQLAGRPSLIPLFDGIRAIPAIADGIGCNCGCAALPGYYSLLSCFEGEAMARSCPICQGQGRLTVRLRKEGKSLDEIRVAIDAQFG